jgi:hypothetical protein
MLTDWVKRFCGPGRGRGLDWCGRRCEEGIKGGMPCAAPIEAENELVEVVLEVRSARSVLDAQAPALEV